MCRSTFVCLLFAGVLVPATLCGGASPSTPTPRPEPVVYTLGAALNYPVGIDVDRYGRLYVLDTGRHAVMRFGVNGELEYSSPDGSHESQYPGGRGGISVTREGVIFLGAADRERNIRRIGPGPSDDATFPGEGALAKDDAGFYTVKRILSKDTPPEMIGIELDDHDPDGKAVGTISLPPLNALRLGPDRLLYGMVKDRPLLSVFDLSGKLLRQIEVSAAVGAAPTGDSNPFQIDTNGDIYFYDGNTVQRLDSTGRRLARWETSSAHCGSSWIRPDDLKVRNGLIYHDVLCIMYNWSAPARPGQLFQQPDRLLQIDVYTPDGQCVARYVPKMPLLNMPSSIAVQSDGSYALALHGMNSILIFDVAGNVHRPETPWHAFLNYFVTDRPGGGFYICGEEVDNAGKYVKTLYIRDGSFGEHEIDYPGQVAVDPVTGNLWALGGWGSMTAYAPAGGVVKRLGKDAKLNFRTFSQGMVIDPQGFIYLTDSWKHRVVKVDFDGNIAAAWGKEGSGLGEMRFPEGLALDAMGRLCVADCENSRIQVFSPDGEALGVWGTRGSGDGQLDRPFALTIGPNNTLWIADTFNDRIVKVPLDRFWREITKEIKPEPVVEAPKKEPVPAPGQVTVTGIVIAGSDDLTDVIYIESSDRSWGARVTLPMGKAAARGDRLKVIGQLELKERAAKHILAGSVQTLARAEKVPGALGMANLYVGDGYRSTNRPTDLSNLGLLIRTWGRVVCVEPEKSRFTVNDGSYLDKDGLIVYAGNLQSPLAEWPKVGQYLGITGVSVTWAGKDGSLSPGVRIRGREDVQVLAER